MWWKPRFIQEINSDKGAPFIGQLVNYAGGTQRSSKVWKVAFILLKDSAGILDLSAPRKGIWKLTRSDSTMAGALRIISPPNKSCWSQKVIILLICMILQRRSLLHHRLFSTLQAAKFSATESKCNRSTQFQHLHCAKMFQIVHSSRAEVLRFTPGCSSPDGSTVDYFGTGWLAVKWVNRLHWKGLQTEADKYSMCVEHSQP